MATLILLTADRHFWRLAPGVTVVLCLNVRLFVSTMRMIDSRKIQQFFDHLALLHAEILIIIHFSCDSVLFKLL